MNAGSWQVYRNTMLGPLVGLLDNGYKWCPVSGDPSTNEVSAQ